MSIDFIDIIVQQNIIWFVKSCHIFAIPTTWLRSTTFNDKNFMNFYTYIKETIKKIFSRWKNN
jgi:hypothetical protein